MINPSVIIPQANEEKLVVSSDSPHKAEDIELLEEEDSSEKTAPVAGFPELDELAKVIEDYDDFGAPVEVSNQWGLPAVVQAKVMCRGRLKLYSPAGVATFRGYIGQATLMAITGNSGRIQFLFHKADMAKILRLFLLYGTASAKSKSVAGKASLGKYLGFGFKHKPIRGIKEQKSFNMASEIGVRVVDIKMDLVKESNLLKSPWVYLGSDKRTIPAWKLLTLDMEPTGEHEFVWVDISYEA